jgi:hypothetical protein
MGLEVPVLTVVPSTKEKHPVSLHLAGIVLSLLRECRQQPFDFRGMNRSVG